MNNSQSINEAADRIWTALQQGKPCAPIRDIIGTEDLEAAYQAQAINTSRKTDSGAIITGVKVGLTSLAVQKQLGVDQPDFGILTDRMHVEEGGRIAWKELMQPKVEAEVAFVLADDIDNASIDEAGLRKAIKGAAASIEIVGSRIENWDIRITDTIADNASASHYVVSEHVVPLDQVDLINCKMKLYKEGEVVSEGVGSACLGNPLHAALWLAKTMIKLGQPLKKGQVILAGALGPMVPVTPGASYRATIDGLGQVNVSFDQP